MKFRKKIISFLSLFLVAIVLMPNLVMAQASLDAIKSKLEGAGIEVIDYSSPENKWGSLPVEWTPYMSESFEGIADIATNFDSAFTSDIGLVELNTALALAEAEKTQLTLTAEIKAKEEKIKLFKVSIVEVEAATKKTMATFMLQNFPELIKKLYPEGNIVLINQLIDEKEITQKDLLQVEWDQRFGENRDPAFLSQLNAQKNELEKTLRELDSQYAKVDFGVDLLYKEINFYFNHNKWAGLPDRIVGFLELEGYENLNQLAEKNGLLSPKAQDREAGLATLKEELASIEGLSSSDVEVVINSTILLGSQGEAQINQIGLVVTRGIQNIAAGIAILWIVIAGVRMIFAEGDEATTTEQKTSILYGVIGLVVILLIGRIVEVLYGPAGVNRTTLVADVGFSNEVYGIVAFLKALVGTVAIFFIVLSAVRMLFAQGDEAEITKERTSILWVGAGIILIAINEIVIKNIFVLPASQSDQITSSNIAQIINTFANVMKFLLGFVGVITLGILVYGAGMMIMNYGDDEAVTNAKKIIRNAIIGILIILSAYVIVASLVTFN